MGAVINAIEYVFPKKEVTNADLQNQFPEYDFNRFEKKVGVKTRFVVAQDETALDLAEKACNKLFTRVDKTSIDYILYCTQSPEYFLPSTACILQARLGLEKQVGAFDFNLGCSGYTYGLSMAKAFIDSKQAKNVLLVTAETYSKYLHPLDRTNRSIFGDAASATLISASKEDGLGNFVFGTDGLGADKLIVKNGASKFNFDKNPTIKEYGTGNKFTDNHLYMNGPDVFNFTLDTIPNVNEQVLEKNNIDKSVVSQFILHQANAFMLNFLRKRMKINKENFYINLEHGGNTVSSTIPIALKEYSKTITAKEIIMLLGFGVGLSWCGGVLKLNKSL